MKKFLTTSALAVALGMIAGVSVASEIDTTKPYLFCKKAVIGDSGKVLYYVRDFRKDCRAFGDDQPERDDGGFVATPDQPERDVEVERPEVDVPEDNGGEMTDDGSGREPTGNITQEAPQTGVAATMEAYRQ